MASSTISLIEFVSASALESFSDPTSVHNSVLQFISEAATTSTSGGVESSSIYCDVLEFLIAVIPKTGAEFTSASVLEFMMIAASTS